MRLAESLHNVLPAVVHHHGLIQEAAFADALKPAYAEGWTQGGAADLPKPHAVMRGCW